jgi:molybdopterin-guanine dinucleotide biosynthesis protein B
VPTDLDLILVEGYKPESFPKIELHRPSLGRPLLCAADTSIIAVAADATLDAPPDLPILDMNSPETIAQFILTYIKDTAVAGT